MLAHYVIGTTHQANTRLEAVKCKKTRYTCGPSILLEPKGGDDVTAHSPRARRSTVEAEQSGAYNPVLARNICCSACTGGTDPLRLQTTIAGSFRVNLVGPQLCVHTWTHKRSHFGLETTSANLQSLSALDSGELV